MKDLKEFDYLKAWLLFFLIASVFGGVVAMVLVSSAAAFLSSRGLPLPQLTFILQTIGLVIAMPISYLTFRVVVGKYLFPKLAAQNNPPHAI